MVEIFGFADVAVTAASVLCHLFVCRLWFTCCDEIRRHCEDRDRCCVCFRAASWQNLVKGRDANFRDMVTPDMDAGQE